MLTFLTILGSLGVFLFGMRVMSEALQKISGEKLRGMMRTMTGNRFSGLGTGFLVTCLVQSSSASTVMVVSFVNAGLLTLREAIGMILGANLGTTTTFWLVSFLGFKFSLSAVALPINGIGMPLLFLRRHPRVRDFGEFLIGFGLLFMGLLLLRDSVPNIQDNPEALEFIQNFTGRGYVTILFFFAFGTFLTVAVQSSSVAGAITLTMAYKGWIDYHAAVAIILGENVGTTITANLAALAGNTSARRAALAHFVFNIIGVVWAIALFHPFARLVDWLVPGDSTNALNLPFHMAGFHSLFNLFNIALMIGFVPRLTRLVERAFREKPEPEPGHVGYRTATMPQTGELNLVEAERDLQKMGAQSRQLLDAFIRIFEEKAEDPAVLAKEMHAVENASDQTAVAVTDYLLRCSAGKLSEASMLRVSALLRVVAELEDICDCGYRLVQLAARKTRKNRQLPAATLEEIRQFADLLYRFTDFWQGCLLRPVRAEDMETAYTIENLIDASRKRLRKESMQRMQAGPEAIKAEMLYIDMLNNMERMGNHSLNILQALRHAQ